MWGGITLGYDSRSDANANYVAAHIRGDRRNTNVGATKSRSVGTIIVIASLPPLGLDFSILACPPMDVQLQPSTLATPGDPLSPGSSFR